VTGGPASIGCQRTGIPEAPAAPNAAAPAEANTAGDPAGVGKMGAVPVLVTVGMKPLGSEAGGASSNVLHALSSASAPQIVRLRVAIFDEIAQATRSRYRCSCGLRQ
jgi:hypothetical protein